MPTTAQHRPSLEPLAPALIGIGLVHVLAGILIWTVLPFLVPKNAELSNESAKLVWRSPSDFLIEDVSVPVVPPSHPVVVATNAPAPTRVTPPLPPTPVASIVPEPPKTLSFTPVKGSKTQVPAATSVSPQTLSQISSTITSMVANSKVMPSAGLTINSLESDPLMRPASPVAPETKPVAAISAETPLPPSVESKQGREANKYITISDKLTTKESAATPRPGKPVLNLLDIALLNENKRAQNAETGGADMEAVKKALERAILREWKAPPIQSVPLTQRRVTVEMAVMRDGTVTDIVLKTHSGSESLDASVRAAAIGVAKIPETLPSSFPKERYDLRVNFQIE